MPDSINLQPDRLLFSKRFQRRSVTRDKVGDLLREGTCNLALHRSNCLLAPNHFPLHEITITERWTEDKG